MYGLKDTISLRGWFKQFGSTHYFCCFSIVALARSVILGYLTLCLSSSLCDHRIMRSRLHSFGFVYSWFSIFSIAAFSSLAICLGVWVLLHQKTEKACKKDGNPMQWVPIDFFSTDEQFLRKTLERRACLRKPWVCRMGNVNPVITNMLSATQRLLY